MIEYEDFSKLDLVVGEVAFVNNKTEINCGEKIFKVDFSIDAKVGDKIIVGIFENKITIPLINGEFPIIPDGNVEIGDRVSWMESEINWGEVEKATKVLLATDLKKQYQLGKITEEDLEGLNKL